MASVKNDKKQKSRMKQKGGGGDATKDGTLTTTQVLQRSRDRPLYREPIQGTQHAAVPTQTQGAQPEGHPPHVRTPDQPRYRTPLAQSVNFTEEAGQTIADFTWAVIKNNSTAVEVEHVLITDGVISNEVTDYDYEMHYEKTTPEQIKADQDKLQITDDLILKGAETPDFDKSIKEMYDIINEYLMSKYTGGKRAEDILKNDLSVQLSTLSSSDKLVVKEQLDHMYRKCAPVDLDVATIVKNITQTHFPKAAGGAKAQSQRRRV